MAFPKVGGIFKIASSQTVDFSQWKEFKASTKSASQEQVAELDKSVKSDDLEVVASIDPDNFIYIHTTIMAGVKTADNGYWIIPETEKFINDNNDSWTCDDLLKDYQSFRTATTFVEHQQHLELAKGKCIDAIARNVPNKDTILIDVLFSVDKRHKDLVANIQNGIINAVSMGCSTEYTLCSICGNKATNPTEYCDHIRNQKGAAIKCKDGNIRRVAEICKNNTFFDVSLVANPAFVGAIFRKILSTEEASRKILANLLNRKIEKQKSEKGTLLKAASIKDGDIEIHLSNSGELHVKENSNEIVSGNIPEDEATAFNAIFKNENAKTKFLGSIVDKYFSKGSSYGHPIVDDSYGDDYTIDRENYDPIPYRDPHNVKDDFIKQDVVELEFLSSSKTPLNKTSRISEFECYNCGYKQELWQVKAASIDSYGNCDILTCPGCNFKVEAEIKYAAKSYKPTRVDIMQLKELGFNDKDIKELSGDQIQIILRKEYTKKEFERDPMMLRKSETVHNIQRGLNEEDQQDKMKKIHDELKKGNQIIASSDIPYEEEDEGIFHYDEHGASVITKNERLTFVAVVQNGEYGLFKTQFGEEFYMPMSLANKQGFKKNNLG